MDVELLFITEPSIRGTLLTGRSPPGGEYIHDLINNITSMTSHEFPMQELLDRSARETRAFLRASVRRGMEHAVKKGRVVSLPPLGYRTTFDKPGGKTAVFDEQAPLVAEGFRLIAKPDMSLRKVEQILLQKGLTGRNGRPIGRATLIGMIKNPFYCGLIRYKGTIYAGNHEALISKTLFKKVQSALRRRRR